MKLTKTILSTILFSFFLLENGFAQCYDPVRIEYISANNIRAAIRGAGTFFWNSQGDSFITPYSPGATQQNAIVPVSSLWIGGIDNKGNLNVAAQTFGNATGRLDFFPGPIDDATSDVFDEGCKNFNRVWKVNRGEILWIKEDFEDNGTIDFPIPDAIKSWPARGNPFFENEMGFTLPDQDLAPFFDRNNNGLFEPSNGDYPIIGNDQPNAVPDEMTWAVSNDIAGIHGETYGLPIGAEVHFMTYTFNCIENEPLNRTIFTRHKIINKSGGALSNFRVAIWSNIDAFCLGNDFFGCDTSLQTFYFYRGKNDDLDPFCFSYEVYGDHPPVFTITFLNQELSTLTYFNSSAIGNPIPGTTAPTDADEFFSYMVGRWRDATPITFGGDGYDPGSTDFVNHVFFDNPNNPQGWSMENEDIPLQNRNTVMGSGGFNFQAGTHIVLDAVFSFRRNVGLTSLQTVNDALIKAESFREFYENNLSGGCTQSSFCDSDCVWPGDANQDGVVKHDDLLYLGLAMGDNFTGFPRIPSSFLWMGHRSNDWAGDLPGGGNAKHTDFSGDGHLDSTEVAILNLNYRLEKPGYIELESEAPFRTGEIYIDFDLDEVSTTGSLFQRSVVGRLSLASANNPIDELYGIAFTMKFDTSVWEPSFGGLTFLNSAVTPVFSDTENCIFIAKGSPEEGRLEIAISKKNGQPISNAWGNLGIIRLAIREDAATGNPNGMQSLSVQFYDAVGVDAAGNFFQLGAATDVVIGKDMVYDETLTNIAEKLNNELKFNIYPNPNHGAFNLFFEKTNAASHIHIFDFSGKIISKNEIPAETGQYNIDLKNELSAGIYFIKWVLADGQFATKKIIIK